MRISVNTILVWCRAESLKVFFCYNIGFDFYKGRTLKTTFRVKNLDLLKPLLLPLLTSDEES